MAGSAVALAFLLGESPVDAKDPDLPTGPALATELERPREEPGRRPVCSFRQPVCVHAGPRVAPLAVLGVLDDLERASGTLAGAVGAPRPLPDGKRGGTPAFDVYLVPARALGNAAVLARTGRDAPAPASLDRASSFGLLRDDLPPGCLRRNLVARTLASAVGWGIDAGDEPHAREANAAYLAELAAPCGSATAELIDDFQAHPERGLIAPGGDGPDAAAVALPWFFDRALGQGAPGSVPIALAIIAGQRSPAGSTRWENEPDLFDALGGVAAARTPPVTLGDLWIDFAVSRLFMGERDDGVHFPESSFAGTFGRVRFDWSVTYDSLPRRLSPERPIDPSGSSFVWIDLARAPKGARLAFRMEWEAPVPFRWALVRVRPDGSEASRVLVTPQQKATSADKNLDDLDGLAGVAVVAVNVGDLRLDDPFDPDIAPYEPHSYVLTIAKGLP